LPSRWIDNLLGRTTDKDDGRIFELLESAREMWWAPSGPASAASSGTADSISR